MKIRLLILTIAILSIAIYSCSPVSSSVAIKPTEEREYPKEPVFLTQTEVPSGIKYKKLAIVKANARVGYDNVESLYPLLATEARKIGANAVFNIKGSRKVTAFSWAAPFVSGTAVKVNDINDLNDISGSYY